MAVDPSECYEQSDFGVGPFPESGGTVACAPQPANVGFGGIGYGLLHGYGSGELRTGLEKAVDGGYGGSPYGHGPYGNGLVPRIPIEISGGYGGDPYGLGPYGTTEDDNPSLTSALSLDGFRIEVFFSEEMYVDAALLDPASYVLTGITGAAPATVLSVEVGVVGGTSAGATSVIITHTGTTLGGVYDLTVTGPTDLAGNPIEDPSTANSVTLLTLGEPPNFTVTPLSGNQLLIDFDQDMLPESGFSPGIEDPDAYAFDTTYPVDIIVENVTHPYLADDSQAVLDVRGMTSVDYTARISPAEAINYDGSILPDNDPNFLGVEIGTGSSSVLGGQLLLAKLVTDTYGWSFEDTSGRILPGSSYRVDFVFDASVAAISPPLFDAVFAALHISDGATQVSLIIERIAGVDSITILSGAFSSTVTASWSTGETTLTLVRNQKADTFAFLFNGTPLRTALTGFFTGGSTISPGAQFLLDPTYAVSILPIKSLLFSSTQTVFSGAWNFLHDNTFDFLGNGDLSRNALLTQRGPLVKGWGDGTPATKNDVEVRVNGVPVEVESVNPYIGEIVLVIPIPLMAPGDITVDVDYIWFCAPVMAQAGLNTFGLVLNKWDIDLGHHTPFVAGTLGVVDTARWPMSLVLGPVRRLSPIQIGHRYIGYERDQTASLNSPTSLLLNQNPHKIAVQTFEESPDSETVSYEAVTTPFDATEPWELEGVDTGQQNPGLGTYTLIDDSAGSYDDGTAALYFRETDLSFSSSVTVAARYQVTDFVADGVFTGVGFGVHNNRRFFFVGNLIVNGVQHIGMLTDLALPEKVESWTIGPTVQVLVLDQKTFTLATTLVPISLEFGDRFQILTGNQAGVYTIENFINQTDGTTTVIIEEVFPGDPFFFGNDKPYVSFEVVWENLLSTYRLVVTPDTGTAQLSVSGEISALVLDILTIPELAMPSQTSLIVSTAERGQVFWGSASRIATNETTWSFLRYGVFPLQTTFHSRGVVVSSEMNSLPEDDPNSEWFNTQRFGFSEVDITGGVLLLKSTAEDPNIDMTFGYSRVEPFLNPTVHSDVDAKFRVDSGVLGAGDAIVRVNDKNRETRLATLLYLENVSPYRQLINVPVESFTGLRSPVNQNWDASTVNTISGTNRGLLYTTTQTLGDTGTFSNDLDLSGLIFTDSGDRIIEARFAVIAFTDDGSGNTGIIFGGEAGPFGNSRLVALTLIAPTGVDPARVALTSDGTPIQLFDFDWTDGEQHSYRVLVNTIANAVTAIIDDVVQTPTVALTLFDIAGPNTLVFFGLNRTDTASVIEWSSVSTQIQPPTTAKRTIGVWLGGDVDDIDSWKIPRTDTTDYLNSSSGAIVEEMDWRSDIQVRIHRDVTWGVVILRPDLPLPPFWNGNFATQSTEPSAGWISVEYVKLPRVAQTFGAISWGSLDSRAVTQQRWDFVRYRLYTHLSDDFRSPHHMVLNKFNVITSGEALKDTTPEILQTTSLTSTTISLLPGHIYADRVFKVLDGSTIIDFTKIEFNRTTQIITLLTPLSGDKVTVTVVFAPSKDTVTTTYLKTEPFKNTNTVLNEGTPPVPKQQTTDATSQVTFGSKFNDPNDVLNSDPDFVLNDPFRTVEFTDDPDALYDCMKFFEVDDGRDRGLPLTTICDDSYPGNGLIGFGLSGFGFTEQFIGGPGSLINNSPFPTNPQSFILSGGTSTVYSTYTPEGNAVFFPNNPLGQTDGTDFIVFISLQTLTTVIIDATGPIVEQDLIDDAALAPTVDNTPPSYSTDPNLVPNGTPGANLHGAVLAVIEEATQYTRLGPWGGLSSLEPNSLLEGSSAGQPTGIPPSGFGFVLAGGSPLPGGTITVTTIEAAN